MSKFYWRAGLVGLLAMCGALLLAACGDNASTISTSATTAAPDHSNSSGTSTTPAPTLANQPSVKAAVGFTAPDFTVKDVNGQTLQLSALRGKNVLLNFWAVY